jgi:hypothetical protein
MAMAAAGLGAAARDERGLMPLAGARAVLKGLTTVVRGDGRMVDGVYVLDSDRVWAALLSLDDADELVRTAALEWKMPPRGLDNPAIAERYGSAAIDWVSAILARKSDGPGHPCLEATLLVHEGGERGLDCAIRLHAAAEKRLFLWTWLKQFPKAWSRLLAGVESGSAEHVRALGRLAKTDPKGAFAALATASDAARARGAFERAGVKIPQSAQASPGPRTPISLGAIEPHFLGFTYPMWDNMNYFTGAMRVTGFVCDAGEALVWEQLSTGLGEGSLRREVTVHPSFPMKHTWLVHTETLLGEGAIVGWDGDDEVCVLTGVRRSGKAYIAPADGPRTSAVVPKLGCEVPLAIDVAGLDADDVEVLEEGTGPAERLLIRLGQAPHRSRIFAESEELARQAKLPDDARALFSFDVFEMPSAGERAASSPDLVAMVDALAARQPLPRLPSHGLHPLHAVVERCRVLGGWGDHRFFGA